MSGLEDPVGGVDGAGGAGARVAEQEDGASAPLLALVDRFAAILEKGDLGELEVSAGGTTIVVRSQAALERRVAATETVVEAPAGTPASTTPVAGMSEAPGGHGAQGAQPAATPAVKAPLTGIYYGAPSPGATPYVAVGDHVQVGQIIGLIEAMKLFNEIKSDLAGRVTRICAENGQLVKAKQPLIEVERA